MKTKAEIDHLNSIPIADYLSQIGHKPIKEYGSSKFYRAPYREDNDPSFHVDLLKNRWFDFGTGKGGYLIQLVIEINGCTFKQACNILEEKTLSQSAHYRSSFQNTRVEAKKGIEVIEVRKLRIETLVRYFYERNISIEFALKYCKEVVYKISNNRTFVAIGFANRSGGYALRSPSNDNSKGFKGCTCQDYTFINNQQPVCCVFEGFFDFLSYLTMLEKRGSNSLINNANYIILNSITNLQKATAVIENHCFVIGYLDNDPGGDVTTKNISKMNIEVFIDARATYAKHKDFNEFWMFTNEEKTNLTDIIFYEKSIEDLRLKFIDYFGLLAEFQDSGNSAKEYIEENELNIYFSDYIKNTLV